MPKPTEYYVGVLSGTSIDALDVCLVAFTEGDSGQLHIKLEHARSFPFPDQLQTELAGLCTPRPNELVRFGLADRDFSCFAASSILALLQESKLPASAITAIGSHGQTVRHHPELAPPFTLQLGCPDTLAVNTGIAVVSHFRQKDMALAGQGAPLAPALHQALFRHDSKNRAIVNLGGIANITYLPSAQAAQQKVIGFDCGPANTLLDQWYQHHHPGQSHFDSNGDWAQQGQIQQGLLNSLLSDSFFHKPPPKSTGREYFTLEWLQKHLQRCPDMAPVDVQATLLALTTETLCQALEVYGETSEAFLCGGGAHNQALLNSLQTRLPAMRWQTTTCLGVDPDWVEGMLFAWLARQYMHQQHGNLTAVTGASREAILGRYTPV